MRWNLLLGLLLVTGGWACSDPEPQLPLPMPDGVQIEWFEGGGMGAESELVRLSADSLYHEIRLNQKQTVHRLPYSREDLEAFYRSLNDAGILQLVKTHPPDVYAQGGQAIWIRLPGQTFQIVHAADALSPPEAGKFEFFSGIFRKEVDNRLAGSARPFRIGLADASPLDPIRQVHVFVERETAFYRKKGEKPIPEHMDTLMQLLPGPYVVQVSGERKSGSFWEQQTIVFEEGMSGLEIEVYGVTVEFKKTIE